MKNKSNYEILFKQLLLRLYEYRLFAVCKFVYFLVVGRIHDAMDETKFFVNKILLDKLAFRLHTI